MLEEVARRSLNLLQLILFLIYPQETSHNTFLFNTLRRGTNAGYQVNVHETWWTKVHPVKFVYPASFRFQFFFWTNLAEPVQERIIYWSFPRHESDICRYSSLSRVPASILTSSDDVLHGNQTTSDNPRSDNDQAVSISPTLGSSNAIAPSRNLVDEPRDPRRQPDGGKNHKSQHPFYRGIKLLEQGCVQNVLQVGKYICCFCQIKLPHSTTSGLIWVLTSKTH